MNVIAVLWGAGMILTSQFRSGCAAGHSASAALLELATARPAGNGSQPKSCGSPGWQVS